jgi:hypothetical protein
MRTKKAKKEKIKKFHSYARLLFDNHALIDVNIISASCQLDCAIPSGKTLRRNFAFIFQITGKRCEAATLMLGRFLRRSI